MSLGIQKANASSFSDSIPKLKVNYMISFNGNYSRNRVEQFLISTNNSLTLQRGKIGLTQALSYQYSLLKSPLTAPRTNILNEIQANSKLSVSVGHLEPLIIVGYEKSKFRSILNRYFAIVGADYKMVNSKLNHFSVLLGPSTEAASYLDGSNYNDLFMCIGLRGLHELNQNKSKFKLQYNTYFFRRFNKNIWRYQGVVSGMYQVLKPLYATINMSFSEEKIVSSDTYRKNTTITFGLTYRI